MKDREVTYLACPFTHPDRNVMLARVKASIVAHLHLTSKGIHVFNPLPHAAHLQLTNGWDATYEFIMEFDELALQKLCNSVTVLQIDGFIESAGIKRELALAERLGIPWSALYPEGLGMYYHFPYSNQIAAELKLGVK